MLVICRDVAAKEHSFMEEAALIKYFSFLSRLLTTSYTTIDRSGMPVAPAGFDTAKFLAGLKSVAVETIDPLWNDEHLALCPFLLASSLLQLVKHLVKPDAPEAPAASSAVPSNANPVPHHLPIDPTIVAILVDMGFEEPRVIQALNTIQSNSIEAATEWLFLNMSSSQDEESEIARAMALSMQADASAAAPPAESGDANPPSAAAASSSAAAPVPAVDEKEKRVKELLEKLRETLLDRCLSFASAGDSQVGFAVVDALSLVCADEKGCKDVIESLDKAIATFPAEPAGPRQSLLHIFAVMISENADCRKAARTCGFLKRLSGMLQNTTLPSSGAVPLWVCPCLLIINILLQPTETPSKPQVAPQR